MLKYLRLKDLYLEQKKNSNQFLIADANYAVHLNKLIIDQFQYEFEYFQMFIKQTPNLKSLSISTFDNHSILNADEWQKSITSSLPYLNIFMFHFQTYSKNRKDSDIIHIFERFQNDFWKSEHHWHTAYILGTRYAQIFTIPYWSNTFELDSYVGSYSNKSINSLHIFDKVTNLTLSDHISFEKLPYYFSNVTSLTLKSISNDSNENCLFNNENLSNIKRIINLSKLKHLDVQYHNHIKASMLIELFKISRQLSELTINMNLIRSFLDNKELCEYLSKMIKKLDISNCHGYYDLEDFYQTLSSVEKLNYQLDYFDIEKFYQTFSNVEKLDCQFGPMYSLNPWDFWLSLLSHSSQFSSITIWDIHSELVYKEIFHSRLVDEARRRNLVYEIILPYVYAEYFPARLEISIDEKKDCLSTRFL
jgi:hypothetical protein